MGTIGNADVDYILPYWMARFYGVLNEFKVQSAAAAATNAIAPDSLASLYGTGLANQTAGAGSRTISLGGVSLRITDGTGAEHFAQLLYVSPTQINFLVPSTTAIGLAGIAVVQAGGILKTIPVQIQSTAPALFTINRRTAAATAIRVQNGIQVPVAPPFELSETAPVYLSLYGTGIRRRQRASATVKGIGVPILYAGAQPGFQGLDQVNIELPASLRGSGEVEIVITIDDQSTNSVFVDTGSGL